MNERFLCMLVQIIEHGMFPLGAIPYKDWDILKYIGVNSSTRLGSVW